MITAAAAVAGAVKAARWLASVFARVPWQAWLFIALVAAFWWHGERRYDAGVSDERARWQAAQAKATAKAADKSARRDEAARAANADAGKQAAQAVTETRTQTAAAVERVRYETRTIYVPAGCPTALPDRVRDEGRAAVERARAAGSGLRARGHAGRAGLAR